MTYNIVFVLIIIIWVYLNSKQAPQDTKKVTILLIVILGLLAGCRYVEYGDFHMNYRRMIQVQSMDWSQVFSYSDEWLHQVIRKIISLIISSPQAYFIISSLFIVGIHLKIAEKFTYDIGLFAILYYSVFSYFMQNNVTRQAIAVAVTMIAWKYSINRKPIRYFTTVIIASLIHTSALFVIPLYFLNKVTINRRMLAVYGVMSVLGIVFSNTLISFGQKFLYSEYDADSYGMTGSNSLRLVLVLLVLTMLILWIRNLKEIEDGTYNFNEVLFIQNGTVMYLFCMMMSVFRVLMFSRIAMYFSPCAILTIINSLDSMEENNRKVLTFLVIAFSFIWFEWFYLSGKLYPTPYVPFWIQ